MFRYIYICIYIICFYIFNRISRKICVKSVIHIYIYTSVDPSISMDYPSTTNNQQPTTNKQQPSWYLRPTWTTILEEIQTSSIHGSKLQVQVYNSISVSWFFEGPNTRLYRFKVQHKRGSDFQILGFSRFDPVKI